MAEENTDLQSKILNVLASNPKGVSNKTLQDGIDGVTLPQLVDNLNKLLAQDKIQILRKGKQLVYVLKNSSSSNKFQGSDIEEKVIFEAVERAGNNGITARELKYTCNLPQPQVNKILKALENKKLIKLFNTSAKKKVYLLYDLEPSVSVTGGTFFSGQEFEAEFVDVLAEQCYKYLLQAKVIADKLSDPISQRNASLKSSEDISNYIANLKISKVNLSTQDIESILETLIYDAKIEKSTISVAHSSKDKKDVQNLYRVIKPLVTSAALMRMPCGVCPIFQDCHPGGPISPDTCVYMEEWLRF